MFPLDAGGRKKKKEKEKKSDKNETKKKRRKGQNLPSGTWMKVFRSYPGKGEEKERKKRNRPRVERLTKARGIRDSGKTMTLPPLINYAGKRRKKGRSCQASMGRKEKKIIPDRVG